MKVVSPPGLAPDLGPSQSAVLLFHHGNLLKLAVQAGAAPAVSTLTEWRVCCFSSGPEIQNDKFRWWLVSVMLRSLILFRDALIYLSYPALKFSIFHLGFTI